MGEPSQQLGSRNHPTLTPEFHEDWFPEKSCRVLKSLVESVRGLEGRVIEIGSWEGRSTVALAHGAYPEPVDAVDTWEGSPGEVSAVIAAERDVYATFTNNMTALTRGNVVAHRMGWREFFATDPGPIRLAFIDAEHSYREVYDTITAVLPHLVVGGVLCGDDIHHEPVKRAATDVLRAVETNSTLWVWRRDD